MIMVVNPDHCPDPKKTSFSCRLPMGLKRLPEAERPNLRTLLKEYGAAASDNFLDRVGADFASGHNEATGMLVLLKYMH